MSGNMIASLWLLGANVIGESGGHQITVYGDLRHFFVTSNVRLSQRHGRLSALETMGNSIYTGWLRENGVLEERRARESREDCTGYGTLRLILDTRRLPIALHHNGLSMRIGDIP